MKLWVRETWVDETDPWYRELGLKDKNGELEREGELEPSREWIPYFWKQD